MIARAERSVTVPFLGHRAGCDNVNVYRTSQSSLVGAFRARSAAPHADTAVGPPPTRDSPLAAPAHDRHGRSGALLRMGELPRSGRPGVARRVRPQHSHFSVHVLGHARQPGSRQPAGNESTSPGSCSATPLSARLAVYPSAIAQCPRSRRCLSRSERRERSGICFQELRGVRLDTRNGRDLPGDHAGQKSTKGPA